MALSSLNTIAPPQFGVTTSMAPCVITVEKGLRKEKDLWRQLSLLS